jgi:hypothetical protein
MINSNSNIPGVYSSINYDVTTNAKSEIQSAVEEQMANINNTLDALNTTKVSQVNGISPVNGNVTLPTLNTGIYVESYFNLKIAVSSGYDYAPCIQAAFDAAAPGSNPVIFPNSQLLQVGTPIRIKTQNGAHIFGNRCILKQIGLTATSDAPIMYYLGLDVPGSSNTTLAYNYNGGVYIHDLKFIGTGYGVGYKHAIAGELFMYNCIFDSTLEKSVVLSGTNGCHFYGCQFSAKSSGKGLFCAKIAEDSYTANYTVQGTGWNDGIYIDGGIINCPASGYGVYYSGSTSEGIIKVSNAKILGGQNNTTGIYGKGFTNMIIEGCWSEYFNGGKVIYADKDNGYEADSLVVRECQFTNHPAGADGFSSLSDYSIYSTAIRTAIDDCVFNNNPNVQHVFYGAGTTNTLGVNTSVTPNAVDTTNGTIDLPKAVIPDTRDLLITDGTINYYLVFASDQGAGGFRYNVHTYSTPIKARLREWRWGSYVEEYWLTRITNPTLSIKSYTVTSPDGNSGYCELNRPIFQGVYGPGRTKCIGWAGFGAIVAKNPITR